VVSEEEGTISETLLIPMHYTLLWYLQRILFGVLCL